MRDQVVIICPASQKRQKARKTGPSVREGGLDAPPRTAATSRSTHTTSIPNARRVGTGGRGPRGVKVSPCVLQRKGPPLTG